MMSAEMLMLVVGIIVFTATILLVRSRVLREKYAFGWLAVSSALLLLGCFPDIIKTLAHLGRLSYPAAVLCMALLLAYPFAFGVSVSLSRQYHHTRRLAQELALLRERLERLEREGAKKEG